jgi:hypothetical protein
MITTLFFIFSEISREAWKERTFVDSFAERKSIIAEVIHSFALLLHGYCLKSGHDHFLSEAFPVRLPYASC